MLLSDRTDYMVCLCLARDLKLDNTLLSDDEPPLIKLCDFGFAREMQADVLMFTHIGYGPSSHRLVRRHCQVQIS